MTLLETIKLLEHIASEQPNVNGIVESGDIYDLNKDEYQQKYSAFCVTQNTHTVNEFFNIFSFTLFYVDRLTLDKANKLQIQSTGVEFFGNFIKTVMREYPELECEYGEVTTFTEKFSAECAGAYMTCTITTPAISTCPIKIGVEPEPIKEKGAFDPMQFSNGFFLWRIIQN